MRLNLDENMKHILTEIVNNALEVAIVSKDEELIESYNRIKKIINQTHYRKLSKDDVESIWHLTDVGERTCDFLLESAKTTDQFEKTTELRDVYSKIKDQINEAVAKKNKFIIQ